MPRITADFYRVVGQRNVCVWNGIVFVCPASIQRNVVFPSVNVPIEILLTFEVVTPAVEYGIVTIGFGNVLQRIAFDKDLLNIFQFVGKHIKRNRVARLTNKCVYIQHTVTEIPVLTYCPNVIARSIQQLGNFGKFNVSVLLFKKRHRRRYYGRRERRSVNRFITAVKRGCIHSSRCDNVCIFSEIAVRSKFPTIIGKCAYTNYVFVSGGICKSCRRSVTGSRNAYNIAVYGKFCRLGK